MLFGIAKKLKSGRLALELLQLAAAQNLPRERRLALLTDAHGSIS